MTLIILIVYNLYALTSSKSATTTSSGGLLLALQRAMLLLAPKGGVTSIYTGPLQSGTS